MGKPLEAAELGSCSAGRAAIGMVGFWRRLGHMVFTLRERHAGLSDGGKSEGQGMTARPGAEGGQCVGELVDCDRCWRGADGGSDGLWDERK